MSGWFTRGKVAGRIGARVAWATVGALTWAAAPSAMAQQKTVYRCDGPPVLYTDSLTAKEASDRGCKSIDGTPITVIQSNRPSKPAAPAASGPRPPESRVDPAAQRARDSDARRILGEELSREEEALAGLRREFKNGEPDRLGDERNYQKYIDRVAEMRATIARKEADVAAIKRELAKLPQ